MPFKLDIIKEQDILKVQITGTRTKATVIDVSREIFRECSEKNCRKLLVDVSKFEEHINVIDIFTLITSDLPELIKERIEKVAIIEPGGNADDKQFFENVAQNRGHNLRIFETEDQALAWLC